jgi:predicted alpha/beta-fold hydrolase
VLCSIEGTWFNRAVYSKAMARNLMNVLKRNVAALSQFTDHPVSQAITDALSLDAPYMFQFDNLITRIIGGSAPHFPFPTQFDYYEWSASDRVISDIRVPYLAINAKDDPLVRESPSDSAGNGWVTLAFTARGGHLGWFESGMDGQMKRWMTKPVLEWCKGWVEQLLLDEHGVIKGRKCRPFKEVDGFLKEVGREEYGCREVGGADERIADISTDGKFQGL